MIDALLPAIERAHLPPSLYRTAVRIAARTDGNGVARLEWSEMLVLAQTESRDTARGQLDRLIAAGVFRCQRNGDVLVIWKMPPANEQESRRFASPDGESYANRVGLPTQTQAESPANEQESRRFAGPDGESYANRVGLPVLPVGNYLTTGREVRKEDPPSLPAVPGAGGPQPPTAPTVPAALPPDPAPAIPAAEQARSLALLTDPEVGVTGKLLAALPAAYPFQQIRLQVCQALRQIADPGSKVTSIGVIGHRLETGAAAIVTPADMASPLWQRHETQAERERRYSADGLTNAERAALYQDAAPDQADAPDPAPQDTPVPDPTPALAAARSLWTRLQAEFALQQPAASVDSVIADSWVIAVDGAVWTVGITDGFRLDWVVKKLSKQIARKLAVIVGAPVTVAFRVGVKGEGVEGA